MELRHAGGLELWLRRARVATLAAKRFGRWAIEDGFTAPERVTPGGPIAASLRVPIARTGADPRLEAGKRHNVRLAATAFHGVVIAPDRPLSFWRTLGPATAARGFSWGMELRSGCAVPAIGGGLCLISNALFALAVELGWHILERHGHSMALGDAGALDATVAYPYVDLRIAPREGRAILEVAVRGDVLALAIHHEGASTRFRVELERHQRDDGQARDTRIRRRVWREPATGEPASAEPASAGMTAPASGEAASSGMTAPASGHAASSGMTAPASGHAASSTMSARAALVEDAVIVDDHQRIPHELRTCLDCNQTACRARVELPEVVR